MPLRYYLKSGRNQMPDGEEFSNIGWFSVYLLV
jgi:hypothetical protein